jgi:hypothetical protein
MTTTATPLPQRPHRRVLGIWVAAGTAVMPPWKQTRRPGQRPCPIPMGVPRAVSRVSWGMVLSTPGAMEEWQAVFLDPSSTSAWTM